jgi:proline iminopeptidase
MKKVDGYIQTNGIKTFYKIIGEGKPLILVHGGPGMAHNYLVPKFKRLAKNNKLIFYDQRACGKTSGEENPDQITIKNLVEDLEALRVYLGVGKINLVGQSFGGLLALNYATKYPQNLKSLIILESAPGSSEYEVEFKNTINKRLTKKEKEKQSQIKKSEGFKNFDPDYHIKYYLSLFKAYFYDTSYHKELDFNYFTRKMLKKNAISDPMFDKYFNNFDIHDKLKKIYCPTLIIHGKYDPIPYQAIEKIHQNINGSELILFDKCGHFAHIENEEKYFSAIEKFVERSICEAFNPYGKD